MPRDFIAVEGDASAIIRKHGGGALISESETSSIGTELLDCLRSVERPGDFYVDGLREIVMPTIDVDDVGRLAFPLLPSQTAQLVARAESAPYGRGGDTVVDRDVRRTWQIGPERVRIGGRRWLETLTEIVAEAAVGLGVSEPVTADFYKLLVYDVGSFFVDHRDTEKAPGMFATMVVLLPSSHRGGELIVRHLGREAVLDLHPEEPSDIGFAAFYADCVHEVRPLVAGCRVALVYNLRLAEKSLQRRPPDHRGAQARVVEHLRQWADGTEAPNKLILPLEHAYTPVAISFETLKGRDAAIASVLVAAAAEANCELHLALISIEESGSAIPNFDRYDRSRRRRRRDNDEENEGFEVDEIIDRELILSDWQRPDGKDPEWEFQPFTEDELCPPDAFEDLMPDEQYFHEATGNEGASFERTYRRAGLVLWPRVRRLAVLNDAGLGTTLPCLTDLTARWEATGGSVDSPLWAEADELSRLMIYSWPERSWRVLGDTDAGAMLDLQVRLEHAAHIEMFLAEISAEGHYAESDNDAIVRGVALLPPARATELLIRIVRRNAPLALGACAVLLRCCATPPLGPVGDLPSVGAALIDVLPRDPMTPIEPGSWRRPERARPEIVRDLVAGLSLIDAELARRAIDHFLAWPEMYPPDDALIPAALALVEHAESAARPAVEQFRQAALAHLQSRIAMPLEAPRDWARENPLTCPCADCRSLGAFLVDPGRPEWRLRAVEARRKHVEQNVRHNRCDLDLATERRGSPHTLIATKNRASYERLAQQRRQDLKNAAVLGA